MTVYLIQSGLKSQRFEETETVQCLPIATTDSVVTHSNNVSNKSSNHCI